MSKSKMVFLNNFASSLGLCAAGAAAFAGVGVMAGAAGPALITTTALGALTTAGVLGVGQLVVLPLLELAAGVFMAFARVTPPETESASRKGFATGTVVAAVLGASGLATGMLQANYNTAAEKEQSPASQPQFTCAANEKKVEQIVTDAAGKRTLTVKCEPV